MKKKKILKNFLLLVFINLLTFSSNRLFSQVTLTATNIPQVGNIYYNKIISDTSITTGLTGANVTWNYTSFYIDVTTRNETFVAPSATPYAGSFPNANLAVNSYFSSTTSGYDFYKTTSNSLEYLGFKNQSDELIITNTQNVLTVPLQYGQSVTNLPVTGTGLFGATLSGTVSANADGYGTLMLDDATYYNALRVLYDFNLVSSFGVGSETYYHIQKYTWYGAARKNPELQISILDISGASTSHQKYVTRAASLAGINESENIISGLEILNNPVHAELKLNIHLLQVADVKMEVSDVDGRIWMTENFKAEKLNHPVTIDVADLTRGIYFVSVFARNNKRQLQIIVN